MTQPPTPSTAKSTIHARVISADPVVTRPASSAVPLWRHGAGRPLVHSAALVTGLGLAPLLLERLQYDVFRTAAYTARAAAPPWPAGSRPTFWPPTVASAAWWTGAVVIVLAVTGVKLPKPVSLVLGLALLGTTASAAWTTIDVVNRKAWLLLPISVLCVLAFAAAAQSLQRWRRTGPAYAPGSPISATLLVWAAALVVLVGGTAIATAAITGSSTQLAPASSSAPTIGSVRAATAGTFNALRGSWVPQVASAKVRNQADADALLRRHQQWAAHYPVVLVRGGDFPSQKLGPEDWMTLVAQRLGSQAAVQAWCNGRHLGPNDCLPRQIPAG